MLAILPAEAVACQDALPISPIAATGIRACGGSQDHSKHYFSILEKLAEPYPPSLRTVTHLCCFPKLGASSFCTRVKKDPVSLGLLTPRASLLAPFMGHLAALALVGLVFLLPNIGPLWHLSPSQGDPDSITLYAMGSCRDRWL